MTIDLTDLLVPDLILTGVAVASKKALFQQVAAAAAPVVGVPTRELSDGLAAREKLASTGVGYGVAIPHAKFVGLPRITAAMVRLAQPIEFRAVDDVPVDLAMVLFSPAEAGAAHLKALARVSRRLRDRSFTAKLRGAGSRDAIWALLTDETPDAV